MKKYKNEGYEPAEIEMLQDECRAAKASFVYVEEDEDEDEEADEIVHIQFVGKYKNESVIYDAVVYTLRLHHGSLVYEQAIEQVQKLYPTYKSIEERDENYKMAPKIQEEADELLTELMEAIEEDEEVKVKEHIDIETDFEYGVSLDVCLNVPAITDEVIEGFIRSFNDGTLRLDTTLYSFSSSEEDEE